MTAVVTRNVLLFSGAAHLFRCRAEGSASTTINYTVYNKHIHWLEAPFKAPTIMELFNMRQLFIILSTPPWVKVAPMTMRSQWGFHKLEVRKDNITIQSNNKAMLACLHVLFLETLWNSTEQKGGCKDFWITLYYSWYFTGLKSYSVLFAWS